MTTYITNQSSLASWLTLQFTETAILQNDIVINPSTWSLSQRPLEKNIILYGNQYKIIIQPTSLGQTWPGLIFLEGGTIQDLSFTLDNSLGTVELNSDGIGWLIGNISSFGTISNLYFSGLLSIQSNDSGIIAGKYAELIIQNCQYGDNSYYGSIIGEGSGGFLGSYSSSSLIQNSMVYVNIYGNNCGGFIGYNSSNFQITTSRAMGNSLGLNQGGFVGSNGHYGTISDSYSFISIEYDSSSGFIGGISGDIYSLFQFNIQNSYYLGEINPISGSIGNLDFNTRLVASQIATNQSFNRIGSNTQISDIFPNTFSSSFYANGSISVIKKDSSGNWWIGGAFTQIGFSINNSIQANRIVKFDGKKYIALRSGVNGTVRDIEIIGSRVYVGGLFTTASETTVNRICYWDTINNTWNRMGNNISSFPTNIGTSGSVFKLLYDGSLFLYIAGSYLYANGTTASSPAITVNNICRWNTLTNQFSGMDSGVTSSASIFDMSIITITGTPRLYIGGSFTTAGSISALRIAYWNTSLLTWNAVGSVGDGFNNPVMSFSKNGTDLYIGGLFTSVTPGPVLLAETAKLDTITNTYTALGNTIGPGNDVYHISYINGTLIALGTFSNLKFGLFSSSLNILENEWKPLNLKFNSVNTSIVSFIDSDTLYLPTLSVSSGFYSPYLAIYNTKTNTLSNFINQINGSINSIGFDYSNQFLYIGGNFTQIGLTTVNYIVRLDIESGNWSTLGNGLNNSVSCITIDGDNVYVGGTFTTAGGNTALRIAKWNKITEIWSTLGDGFAGTVNSIVVDGNDIYAGGSFTTSGTNSILRIAKWDGISWTQLGGGLNNTVNTMVMVNTDLYIGGVFTTTSNRIIRWNTLTGAYEVLGSSTGMNSTVRTIVYNGIDEIYIGGDFTTVNGQTQNYIVSWNIFNSTYTSLSTGLNNSVYTISYDISGIYVAGDFSLAGGNTCNRLAKWNGISWETLLGSVGVSNTIFTLQLVNNQLYLGGNFTDSTYGLTNNPNYICTIRPNSNTTSYSTSIPNTSEPIVSFSNEIWNKNTQPPSIISLGNYPYYNQNISYNGISNLILYKPIETYCYIFNQNDLISFLTRRLNFSYATDDVNFLEGIIATDIEINPSEWPTLSNLGSLSNGYSLIGGGRKITIKPIGLNISWNGLINLTGGYVENIYFECDTTFGNLLFARSGMGAFIGNSYSSGNLNGILVSGFTISTDGSGGIVGSYSTCSLQTCQCGLPSNYTIISGNGSGGLTGSFFKGEIVFDCVSYTQVIGNQSGGMIGSDSLCNINKCIANGIITGVNSGGFLGADPQQGEMLIQNSYSLMTVNENSSGGFIGRNSAYGGIIKCNNNYFLGNVISGSSFSSIFNSNQVELYDFASNSSYDNLSESQSLICNYNVEKFMNIPSFTGMNGSINCSAYNSTNNSLYIGGTFTSINGVSTDINGYSFNRIARYSFTDNQWYALANGVNNTVQCIHIYSGTLIFIGGLFTTATQTTGTSLTVNYITLFTTTTSLWSTLSNTSPGVSGGSTSVRSITNIGTTLFVGGLFTTAGGNISSNGIVQYGPVGGSATWTRLQLAVSGTNTNGIVVSLCVVGTNLYLGGTFTTLTDAAGIKNTTRIARWNRLTSRFDYLGSTTATTNGLNSTVNTIVLDPNGIDLWIGGAFNLAYNTNINIGVNGLVKWSTTSNNWSNPLNIGIGGINTLYIHNNQLHIGGSFRTFINGVYTKNYYMLYDISSEKLYSYTNQLYGVSGLIYMIYKSGNYVYIGGTFNTLNSSTDGTGTNYLTDLGNICQLNTTYNITNYTNTYSSTLPPISNFNS